MGEDVVAHLGVLTLDIHIESSQSLKDKRSVVKSLRDRIRSKFNVSVAEVGYLDKWQRSVCAVAMIGNDRAFIDQNLHKIVAQVESFSRVELLNWGTEFV